MTSQANILLTVGEIVVLATGVYPKCDSRESPHCFRPLAGSSRGLIAGARVESQLADTSLPISPLALTCQPFHLFSKRER